MFTCGPSVVNSEISITSTGTGVSTAVLLAFLDPTTTSSKETPDDKTTLTVDPPSMVISFELNPI